MLTWNRPLRAMRRSLAGLGILAALTGGAGTLTAPADAPPGHSILPGMHHTAGYTVLAD